MPIKKIEQNYPNVFGMDFEGKVSPQEIDEFLPQLEAAINKADHKLRLLVDVCKVKGMHIRADWEMFEFLKHHVHDIEFIAIVGAHSLDKLMSEIFSESVFNEAETLYFEEKDIEHAWQWIQKASHPKNQPVRRYVDSDKGLFTKYSSPNYM
ncbi:MAG: STAS/SEC14 domain-containing protein [Candidatus Omnitrophica bacterium]|nr:STAS/SEC14 domain-containing protein [Candidatus Omnitrophota bacterium]